MVLSWSLRSAAPSVTLWDMKLLVTLIGLVLVLEGLPYVASPEAMQRWLKHLTRIPPAQLRVLGLLSMGIGFITLFIARATGLLR